MGTPRVERQHVSFEVEVLIVMPKLYLKLNSTDLWRPLYLSKGDLKHITHKDIKIHKFMSSSS